MLHGFPLEKAAAVVDETEGAGAPAAVIGGEEASEYVERLLDGIGGFRRRLPIYLAVARLKWAASSLAEFDLGSVAESVDGPDKESALLIMRLDEVATLVESTVHGLRQHASQRAREREEGCVGSTVS